MKKLLRLVLLVSVYVGAAGCSLYDKSLLQSAGPQCPRGTPGCVPKNEGSTSTPMDRNDVTFALRDLLVNQTIDPLSDPNQPWKSVGLDLDGIDSTADNHLASCKPYVMGDAYETDGVNGIDNAFGHRLYPGFVKDTFMSLQDDLCCFGGRGRGTVLVRFQNWNGTANDNQVTISLMYSADGTSVTNAVYDPTTEHGYVVSGTSTPAPAPAWTADTDTWSITKASLLGDIALPKHTDPNGYIRNGTFVMQLDTTQAVQLYLGPYSSLAVRVQGGTLYGDLSDDFKYIVRGGVGGRLGQADLLEATVSLGACLQPTQQAQLMQMYSDVLVPIENDINKTCNAISIGIGFHGVRARAIENNNDAFKYSETVCDPTTGAMTTPGTGLGSDDGACGGVVGECTVPAWVDPTPADGGVDGGQ